MGEQGESWGSDRESARAFVISVAFLVAMLGVYLVAVRFNALDRRLTALEAAQKGEQK